MNGLDGTCDQFGQATGDRALRAFALRLQKATRKDDLVGRYGKDTFLYLIDQDPRPRTVLQICEHLARELAFDAHFEQIVVRLSATLGAALFPMDGGAGEALIEAAEQALGRAEAKGVPFDAAGLARPAPGDPAAPVAGSPQESANGDASGQDADRHADRRAARRQRVLKRGQILARGLTSAIDCTIRDVTGQGARLRVDDYFAAPDQFELQIPGDGHEPRGQGALAGRKRYRGRIPLMISDPFIRHVSRGASHVCHTARQGRARAAGRRARAPGAAVASIPETGACRRP